MSDIWTLRTCCWVLEIQFIFFWLFRTLTWPPISSPATPYLLETNPCRIRWETWCRLCCNKCKIPLCKEWWQIQSLYRYVCRNKNVIIIVEFIRWLHEFSARLVHFFLKQCVHDLWLTQKHCKAERFGESTTFLSHLF